MSRTPEQNRHLSDRINAIHQGGYETPAHDQRRMGRRPIIVFRKIADPEESPSSTGWEATN